MLSSGHDMVVVLISSQQPCLLTQDLNNIKPVNILECTQEGPQLGEEILTIDSFWGKVIQFCSRMWPLWGFIPMSILQNRAASSPSHEVIYLFFTLFFN